MEAMFYEYYIGTGLDSEPDEDTSLPRERQQAALQIARTLAGTK
ncbi:MAG: hypothetical protein O6918_13565 [Deltaproteobacteria bacterium]|nr:hypothetical protein [Deltaproteobacteria bacterium]